MQSKRPAGPSDPSLEGSKAIRTHALLSIPLFLQQNSAKYQVAVSFYYEATAPKLVLLPVHPSGLHRNSFYCQHGPKRACECVNCGACERACPQHLAICAELAHCVEALGIAG